jgi:hypothetical protein
MMSLLMRVKSGAILSQLQRMSYDSLFNEFVDTLVSKNSKQLTALSNDTQNDHNYMANKLINSIADALKLFDSNAIANDNYYWYLAWKGLYKTKTWEKHWPNYPNKPIVGAPLTTEDSTRGLKYALTPIRLDSIITVIYNEREANSDSKGRKPVTGGCY